MREEGERGREKEGERGRGRKEREGGRGRKMDKQGARRREGRRKLTKSTRYRGDVPSTTQKV